MEGKLLQFRKRGEENQELESLENELQEAFKLMEMSDKQRQAYLTGKCSEAKLARLMRTMTKINESHYC